MTAEAWTPHVMQGDELTLANIIGQALGTASMCWSETPTGIFDSERAVWVLEGAVAAIEKLKACDG